MAFEYDISGSITRHQEAIDQASLTARARAAIPG